MTLSSPSSSNRVLRAGQFYGQFDRTRQAGVYTVGHWNADPTRSIGLHTHEDAHIVLPIDGAYRSSAWGAPEVCDRSVVIYNPPGTTHQDRFDPVAGAIRGRFFTVSIPAERIRLTESVGHPPSHPVALRHQTIGVAVRKMAKECLHWSPASDLFLEGLCLELLGEIARCRPERSRQAPGWLTAAKSILAENHHDSIEAVAHQVGVHPVYLARMFRKHFGTSPAEFRRDARIARAEVLLRDRRIPIAEVAVRCGFSDQSHLTKTFTNRRGMAPGRFRADPA
jgi:AraC family transcriptional regulator